MGHKGKLNIDKYENLVKDAYEGGSKGHNPLDPNDPKAQDSFGLVDHVKEHSKKVKQ
tara:strand:- start:937 stop:1107 length:171 start_codon:yes stop_codon:yes gene_type:complete